MGTVSVAKEFHRFLKRVDRLTEGQAQVTNINWEDGDLEDFILVIRPNSGLYKGGIFEFQVKADFSAFENNEYRPQVTCLTDIYHPNIDTCDDGNNNENNVCLNVLEIPQCAFGFEGIAMGLIFLLKYPNLEDPLSPLFEGYDDIDAFKDNVAKYMRGEDVDGNTFNINFRVIDGVVTEIPKIVIVPANDQSKDNVKTENVEEENQNRNEIKEHERDIKEDENACDKAEKPIGSTEGNGKINDNTVIEDEACAQAKDDEVKTIEDNGQSNVITNSEERKETAIADIVNEIEEASISHPETSDDKVKVDNHTDGSHDAVPDDDLNDDDATDEVLDFIDIEGECFLVFKKKSDIVYDKDAEPGINNETVIIDISNESGETQVNEIAQTDNDIDINISDPLQVTIARDSQDSEQSFSRSGQIHFSRFRRLLNPLAKLVCLFVRSYQRVKL